MESPLINPSRQITHSTASSDQAKSGLKIAGLVGLILLGGLVSAASAGAIFSYKATPLLLGGLVGAATIGLPIGIGAFVYHQRKAGREDDASQAEASATYQARQSSLDRLQLTPQQVKGLADAILAIPGLADRLSEEGIGRVSPPEDKLTALAESYRTNGTIDPKTDINLLVGVLKRSCASLNLFAGIAIGAKEPTMESVRGLVERVSEDKKAVLSSYIRFFKLLADQQATRRTREEEAQRDVEEGSRRFTAMSLESVATVSAPALKQVEASLSGIQEITHLNRMAAFMIENYADLFPLPPRQ